MADPTATTSVLLYQGLPGGQMPIRVAIEPEVPVKAEVGKEYASGGIFPLGLTTPTPSSIPQFDNLYAVHGDLLIDWMRTDPVYLSSINTIKQAVLCDGIKVSNIIEPDPDDEDEGTAQTASERKAEKDDLELGNAITEFCTRMIARLINERPLESVVFEMLDAIDYRDIAAEVVGEVCSGGPDAGRAVLKSLKVKPRSSWAYEVDAYANVVGYRVFDPSDSQSKLLPRWKLAVLSWCPRKGDPRGSGEAPRAAFNGWNIKLQNFPQWYKFGQKMAAPSVFCTTPPNAQARPQLDSQGKPTGRTVSPEAEMTATVSTIYTNCSVATAPNGSTVTLLESKGDGSAFDRLKNACDREIVLAVLQATRATLEAQHGSKADSETSQDVVGLVVRMAKSFVAHVIRGVLRTFVAANWSDAVADRLTPKVQLGDTDHQDFAQNANAIAALAQCGFLDESQRPGIMTWLGLPPAKPRKDAPVVGPANPASPKPQPAKPATAAA